MIDILYIHPAKQEVDARYDKFASCAPYPFIPVGVVGLMNLLRSSDWQVAGLNLPIELIIEPTFNFHSWLAQQTQPKLVMIDLHWYEHSFGALEVAKAVKSVWATVPIVIGGLTASNFAEEILTSFPVINFIVRGDAEKPLRLLAQYCCGDTSVQLADIPNLLYRANGKPVQNLRSYFASTDDLDQLDFVTLDWLDHWQSYAALQYSGAGVIVLREPKLKGHWLTVVIAH